MSNDDQERERLEELHVEQWTDAEVCARIRIDSDYIASEVERRLAKAAPVAVSADVTPQAWAQNLMEAVVGFYGLNIDNALRADLLAIITRHAPVAGSIEVATLALVEKIAKDLCDDEVTNAEGMTDEITEAYGRGYQDGCDEVVVCFRNWAKFGMDTTPRSVLGGDTVHKITNVAPVAGSEAAALAALVERTGIAGIFDDFRTVFDAAEQMALYIKHASDSLAEHLHTPVGNIELLHGINELAKGRAGAVDTTAREADAWLLWRRHSATTPWIPVHDRGGAAEHTRESLHAHIACLEASGSIVTGAPLEFRYAPIIRGTPTSIPAPSDVDSKRLDWLEAWLKNGDRTNYVESLEDGNVWLYALSHVPDSLGPRTLAEAPSLREAIDALDAAMQPVDADTTKEQTP